MKNTILFIIPLLFEILEKDHIWLSDKESYEQIDLSVASEVVCR